MDNIHRLVVMITGGAQGIGKGIAAYLLEQGWQVAVADCDNEAGEETVEEFRHKGEILFVPTDVTDEDSVKKTVRSTLENFGQLDGLVNNAGIASPGRTPPEELSLSVWSKVISTNLSAYFLCAKHAIPALRETRGAIVNIASTRALQSEANTEAYSASKGGVVALTHALAVSLGPDIRVNCISPGWIEVGPWKKSSARCEPQHSELDRLQHPVGRVGIPQDIAALTAFLLSEDAGFISGQNFVVDGGMTKKMIYAE